MIRDSRTVLHPDDAAHCRMTEKEQEAHTHYASNALAGGHDPECEKVRAPRNWPTLFGHIKCTCGEGKVS